jgi:alcohol dehydrogenase (cytochrome c)
VPQWTFQTGTLGNFETTTLLRDNVLYATGPQNVAWAIDAHLLALDMKTGAVAWDAIMQDYTAGYASTIAPLVVKDKVIVGVAGGEFGIRGFIDAYEAQTGRRAWRFYTIPGPGEPGHETWSADAWKIGGAGVCVTGAYDPEQNLVFYGTGNPGPDYHSESRPGDNLYSTSLVALDADSGRLR